MNTNCFSRPKSSTHSSEPSNYCRKQFLFLCLKEAFSLEVFCHWKEIRQNGNSGGGLGNWPVDQFFSLSFCFSMLSYFFFFLSTPARSSSLMLKRSGGWISLACSQSSGESIILTLKHNVSCRFL